MAFFSEVATRDTAPEDAKKKKREKREGDRERRTAATDELRQQVVEGSQEVSDLRDQLEGQRQAMSENNFPHLWRAIRLKAGYELLSKQIETESALLSNLGPELVRTERPAEIIDVLADAGVGLLDAAFAATTGQVSPETQVETAGKKTEAQAKGKAKAATDTAVEASETQAAAEIAYWTEILGSETAARQHVRSLAQAELQAKQAQGARRAGGAGGTFLGGATDPRQTEIYLKETARARAQEDIFASPTSLDRHRSADPFWNMAAFQLRWDDDRAARVEQDAFQMAKTQLGSETLEYIADAENAGEAMTLLARNLNRAGVTPAEFQKQMNTERLRQIGVTSRESLIDFLGDMMVHSWFDMERLPQMLEPYLNSTLNSGRNTLNDEVQTYLTGVAEEMQTLLAAAYHQSTIDAGFDWANELSRIQHHGKSRLRWALQFGQQGSKGDEDPQMSYVEDPEARYRSSGSRGAFGLGTAQQGDIFDLFAPAFSARRRQAWNNIISLIETWDHYFDWANRDVYEEWEKTAGNEPGPKWRAFTETPEYQSQIDERMQQVVGTRKEIDDAIFDLKDIIAGTFQPPAGAGKRGPMARQAVDQRPRIRGELDLEFPGWGTTAEGREATGRTLRELTGMTRALQTRRTLNQSKGARLFEQRRR